MAQRPTAIGRRVPLPPPSEDLRDPAKGEKVPRCKICGLPERPGWKLIPGLWMYIRFTMELAICERCVQELAPRDPRDADPLTALEDVA